MFKKIYILGIILIVLIVMVVLIQKPFGLDKYFGPKEFSLIKNFNKDNVGKIEITKESTTIELTKNEQNQWLVAGDKFAKQDFVKDALDKLIETKITETVSKNKEKHSNFNLTDETALKLKIFDNNKNQILDLMLGKIGPYPSSVYCRLANSDEVFLIDQNIDYIFDKGGVDNWREKQIFSLDKEKIKQVSLKIGKKEYNFEKNEENNWFKVIYSKKTEVDKTKFENLLSPWLNFEASGFAADNDVAKYGLKEGEESYVVSLSTDTADNRIIGGKEEEGSVYAKKIGDETVYKISASMFKNLDGALKEL